MRLTAARMLVRDRLLSTTWGYRAYMHGKWSAGPRELPRGIQINCALKTQREVDASVAEVRRLRLPPSADPCKDWDSLAALHEILSHTRSDAAILDAGAEMYSRLLPWLFLYGYRNLRGINLAFKRPVHRGPIAYEPGDITATRFNGASFDAIACMSVIEHGVDLDAYFREMARLLRPGGLLVTSTDYFETPTEARGQVAYGTPIRVFTAKDVLAAIAIARGYGLGLTSPFDPTCGDRVVEWKPYGIRYTFVVLAMTKTTSSGS